MSAIIIKSQITTPTTSSPRYSNHIEITEKKFESLKEQIDFTRPLKVKIEGDVIVFETLVF